MSLWAVTQLLISIFPLLVFLPPSIPSKDHSLRIKFLKKALGCLKPDYSVSYV